MEHYLIPVPSLNFHVVGFSALIALLWGLGFNAFQLIKKTEAGPEKKLVEPQDPFGTGRGI